MTARHWIGLALALLGLAAALFGFVEALPLVLAAAPIVLGAGFVLMKQRDALDAPAPLKMRPHARRGRPCVAPNATETQSGDNMSNQQSSVTRVKLRGKETSTTLLTADNTSIRSTPDGGLVIELFRYGANDEPIESLCFHLCPEDRRRLRSEA